MDSTRFEGFIDNEARTLLSDGCWLPRGTQEAKFLLRSDSGPRQGIAYNVLYWRWIRPRVRFIIGRDGTA
jgi:hypothetical protein